MVSRLMIVNDGVCCVWGCSIVCDGCGWKDVGMVATWYVNASRCDVWVVCACLPVCIVTCFVGFWEGVFCWWKCIPT